MKKIILLLSVALVIGFSSCNDDDPDPQGYGDAYVISKLSETGGESEEASVVYGLYMGTSSLYGTLSSVSVTGGGSSYTLKKDNDTSGFYYESDEYDTDLPAEGTYTFNYTFTSGEIASSANVLTDDALIPANITSCTFADDKIELEWDEVEDADVIYIQLRDADDDWVFSSLTNSGGYLPGDETDYTISSSSGTWNSDHSMTDGATYTVEIIALLAESATSSYLQAQAIASSTIVWGE